MKVDPFAPQLLIEYDLYCRRHGHTDFGTYMCQWYAVQAFIEAALEEGMTPEETAYSSKLVFPIAAVN